MKIKAHKDDRPRVSLKAGTTVALEEIDTWPGEFSIYDVIGIVQQYLKWNPDDAGQVRALTSPYQTKEWQAHLRRLVREWVNVRLRKASDEFDLRVYVCYQILGHRRRHWLRLDNLSAKTLESLLQDREKLVDDIEHLEPYLVRGQQKMLERGPDTLFGDVKAEVVEELRREGVA